jgi:hypothetical protein
MEQISNGTDLNGTDFKWNKFQMEQISILNIFGFEHIFEFEQIFKFKQISNFE